MSELPLRVASVPSGHPYVRHLSDPTGADPVVRLADPPVTGAPPGQWWPPPMLDAEWVRSHAAGFDVFHVHFGFESRTPRQLEGLVAALRDVGRPLVVTVHDLRNPHLADTATHLAALDVLVGGADDVVTLTAGAGGEIRRRWGRTATVIPHPHLVDIPRMRRPRPDHDGFVVGLHAKSERANNDSVTVALALAGTVATIPGAVLRVDAHDDEAGRTVATAIRDRGGDGIDVRVHRRFSDDELWDYLSALDVSVLPYRYGTHSGWMEACHDLGTAVLAPTCGFYAEQGPCYPFHHDEAGLDPVSLAEAVHRAHQGGPGWRWAVADRVAQRRDIAAAHRRVYERVLAARTGAGR